jgi:hypothetical protein
MYFDPKPRSLTASERAGLSEGELTALDLISVIFAMFVLIPLVLYWFS